MRSKKKAVLLGKLKAPRPEYEMFRTSRAYSSAVYSVKPTEHPIEQPIDRLITKQLHKKGMRRDSIVAAAKLFFDVVRGYFINSSAASLAP